MANKTFRLFGSSALTVGVSTYLILKVIGKKMSWHKVEGPSMRPTLNPSDSFFRDIILVKKLENPEEVEYMPASSIILLKHPKQERGYLVKRLAANQNEEISNYADQIKNSKCTNKTIPQGHCWVQSDAGPGYLDSTSYLGPIPYDDVVGQALFIVWPPHRSKKL